MFTFDLFATAGVSLNLDWLWTIQFDPHMFREHIEPINDEDEDEQNDRSNGLAFHDLILEELELLNDLVKGGFVLSIFSV